MKYVTKCTINKNNSFVLICQGWNIMFCIKMNSYLFHAMYTELGILTYAICLPFCRILQFLIKFYSAQTRFQCVTHGLALVDLFLSADLNVNRVCTHIRCSMFSIRLYSVNFSLCTCFTWNIHLVQSPVRTNFV